MNKAIIVPIIALAVLFSQKFLHITWSNEEMQTLQEGLLSIIVLVGILTNPKKPE
mgnify:CR=1 FL=1